MYKKIFNNAEVLKLAKETIAKEYFKQVNNQKLRTVMSQKVPSSS